MSRDRAAKAWSADGLGDRTDETLARRADQQGQAEYADFMEPGQRRHALFGGLAKTDAGVEHEVAARNTRSVSDVERAGEKVDDIPDDVDASVDLVAVVHDDRRRIARGNLVLDPGIGFGKTS